MRISEKKLCGVWVMASLSVGVTSFMPSGVYGSPLWFAFWAAVALALAFSVVRTVLWRHAALFALHLSFLFILSGGALTALTARRQLLHLSPGKPCGLVPGLQLTLEKFEPEYYPGMMFPRDFHSYVYTSSGRRLHISMNRIGRLDGWRLYQTSFDGEGGSVLTAVRDPAGIAVTYAGYMLFAVSGLWLLLRRRPVRRARMRAATLMFLAASAMPAVSRAGVKAVAPAVADSLAGCQVVFRGRVVPFATMASEFTYKLTGRGHVGPLPAVRFVASLAAYGESWSAVPFLKVGDRSLARALGCRDGYVALSDLYTDKGEYRLQQLYERSGSALSDAIVRLDEKVALLAELRSGELFTPLEPGAPGRLSPLRVRLMTAYASCRPVLLCSILLLVCAIAGLLPVIRRRPRRLSALYAACAVGAAVVFVWQWIDLGYVPLADSGQIMTFTSAVLAALSARISRRHAPVSALGMLMAGFAALAGWLAAKDPVLSPLMPVLASPWLTIHVSLVMTAYALLSLTLAAGVAGLCRRCLRRPMASLALRLLAPGVYILGLGIFAGAVWANVSWGRYWAWDPKETWALVTLLLYAAPLHRGLGLARCPSALHVYLVLAFLSIVMTYAGVNGLPSLHAYS